MKMRCFVLRAGVARHQVHEALEKIGLRLVNVMHGDEQRLSYEEVWTSSNDKQSVNHVEDPLVNLHYLALRGEALGALAAQLTARLPLYTQTEALSLARDAATHIDQVLAIYRMAVMFPEFDESAFEIFYKYSVHANDPVLREAAVDAMAYRCWPQSIPLLEWIAEADDADTVRRRAIEVLPHVRAAIRSN